MKRIALAGMIYAAILLVPSVAIANPPTLPHMRNYWSLYKKIAKKFGKRTPGCNLILGACHVLRTDRAVVTSIEVFQRMLTPVTIIRSTISTTVPMAVDYQTGAAVENASVTIAAPSGLEACIIQHESGGDPNAVNGQYSGEGQWSQTQWLADGGGKYASTPLGASQSEQNAILAGEGSSGMEQQQGQYDGCG